MDGLVFGFDVRAEDVVDKVDHLVERLQVSSPEVVDASQLFFTGLY